MKYKATKKELKSNYNRIISIGYCDAQHLLKFENPRSYCTRAEGWACDNYDINGVLLSTGYAPIDSRNAVKEYETMRKYNDAACAIACDYSIPYEEQKQRVSELLTQFVNECTTIQ